MRTILIITATLTAVLVIRKTWRKPTAYLLNRVPVATHPDCKPRFRNWKNGEEVFD